MVHSKSVNKTSEQATLIITFVICCTLLGLVLAGSRFLPDLVFPHATHVLTQPVLIWLYIMSDLATGIAYLAIAFLLAYLVYRVRHTIPFQGIFIAFGLFIIACGASHLMHVWTFWRPDYWLEAGVKVMMAVASVTTAVSLPAFVLQVLRLSNTTTLAEERRQRLERANASLRDQMSEGQRVEEIIRHSEARLAVIFRASPVAICITTFQEGRYLEANPAFEVLMGYRRDEVVGRTAKELGVWMEPTERERTLQTGGERLSIQNMEKEFRTKSGESRLTMMTIERIMLDQQDCLLTFLHDITERKHAERKLQRIALALERSNGELENFASVASHDLQEPLRKIIVFGDRLAVKSGDTLNSEGRDYLARMQSSAARMQTLINDLLSFSRVATRAQPFVPIDVANVVRDVLADIEVQIEKVRGCVEVGALPVVDADPTQMRQLFQNLIVNALKFRKPDNAPLVKISCNVQDGMAHIMVQDNGIGFDEKYLDRIFAIFQRLHGRTSYEGSGVGLAVCRKIVERHEGTITARSTPGVGATFIFTLPVRVPELEVGP